MHKFINIICTAVKKSYSKSAGFVYKRGAGTAVRGVSYVDF